MKIVFRILVLPFIFGLILISYNIIVFKHLYDFLKYGGEWITFDKGSKTTIRDLFNLVEGRNKKNKFKTN